MNAEQRHHIIEELKTSYAMELGDGAELPRHSIDLDRRARRGNQEVARAISRRSRPRANARQTHQSAGGARPGSLESDRTQQMLQAAEDSTDVLRLFAGDPGGESAIQHTKKSSASRTMSISVTQEMAIDLLSDEQEHRRQFVGFLSE